MDKSEKVWGDVGLVRNWEGRLPAGWCLIFPDTNFARPLFNGMMALTFGPRFGSTLHRF